MKCHRVNELVELLHPAWQYVYRYASRLNAYVNTYCEQ